MAAYLNIVERAYQGTLEEQDDQAVWLSHALRNAGMEQQLLLRGPAVAYGVRGQGPQAFAVADIPAGNPPRIDHDLQELAGKGVRVLAVREDVARRGIQPEELIPELELVDNAAVPGLLLEAERVFAW